MHTESLRCAVTTVALCVVSILLLPVSPLASQSSPGDGGGTAAVQAAVVAEFRAEALRDVAEGGDVSEAAHRLSRRAEGLVDDFERARMLQLAARLHWHEGDLQGARRTLVRAGKAAYAADVPGLAVRLFLDAAQAAVEDGDRRAAWTAAQRAGRVIHEGDFSVDQRLRLLARVVYADQPATLQTIPPLASP